MNKQNGCDTLLVERRKGMNFTKQFKILIGLIFAIFLIALNFFGQYLTTEQVKQLRSEVDKIQVTPVIVTATPVPTASPSAAVKKVTLPTWTPTPAK